jgi:membrane associated rhomboid family serine protease
VILVAISGGFGVYGVKFSQEDNWIGIIFILLSVFIAIAIFLTYISLNNNLKDLKRIYDE